MTYALKNFFLQNLVQNCIKNYLIESLNSLINSKNSEIKEGSYSCEVCKKIFESLGLLEIHKHLHPEMKVSSVLSTTELVITDDNPPPIKVKDENIKQEIEEYGVKQDLDPLSCQQKGNIHEQDLEQVNILSY